MKGTEKKAKKEDPGIEQDETSCLGGSRGEYVPPAAQKLTQRFATHAFSSPSLADVQQQIVQPCLSIL